MKRQVTQRRCWSVNQSWLVNEQAGHPGKGLGVNQRWLGNEEASPQRSWLGNEEAGHKEKVLGRQP
jgi:hypothetical protein